MPDPTVSMVAGRWSELLNDNVIDVLIYLFENYLEEATELAPGDMASSDMAGSDNSRSDTSVTQVELRTETGDRKLLDEDELSEELVQSGFDANTVNLAIKWLEGLQSMTEDGISSFAGGSRGAYRYYTPDEVARIDVESQGLLLSLERSGVIDPSIRELVIDRIMALESNDIDIDHVRWITMMILCNQTEHVHNLPLAEELVMDGVSEARMH